MCGDEKEEHSAGRKQVVEPGEGAAVVVPCSSTFRHMTESNVPVTSTVPSITATLGFPSNRSRRIGSSSSSGSTATTSRPGAASSVNVPIPAPTSSTRLPRCGRQRSNSQALYAPASASGGAICPAGQPRR